MNKTTERNGINEINKVCKSVMKLQDSDFEEIEKAYKNQLAYISPLKMATTSKQHMLGEHNEKVIIALKVLRDVIKDGEAI